MKQVDRYDVKVNEYYLYYCKNFGSTYRHFVICEGSNAVANQRYGIVICDDIGYKLKEYKKHLNFGKGTEVYEDNGAIFELTNEEVVMHLVVENV